MTFSALILAGGKSSRMGRDKALLQFQGKTLLQRQIDLIGTLGQIDLLISCRDSSAYPISHYTSIQDNFPQAGPVAGIESGLRTIRSSHLMVLAVDLPYLDQQFLRLLMSSCDESTGVVPRLQNKAEPLVAIYPKAAHQIAIQLLTAGKNAAREFADTCEAAGLVKFIPVSEDSSHLFHNWNSPADIKAE